MNPLLNKDAVMEILGLKDKKTLMKMVHNGKLPHRQIGNKIMFSEEDLTEYIRKCRRVGRKDVQRHTGEIRLDHSIENAKSSLLELVDALNKISNIDAPTVSTE